MNEKEATRLLARWECLACDGMGNAPVGAEAFMKLAKDTFFLLSRTDPRSVTNPIMRILVLMQEFADHCWYSDQKCGLTVLALVSELLYGFLDGFQKTGSAYPRLKLTDTTYTNSYFDFSSDTLADLQFTDTLPF